jgi:hypothetical protein
MLKLSANQKTVLKFAVRVAVPIAINTALVVVANKIADKYIPAD